MKIISPAFAHQSAIPLQYTCMGANVNPPLQFVDIPPQAKSVVLLVDDPDAPGGIWTHWLVFNIPPSVVELAENTSPPGVEGITSFGEMRYGGPCPSSGTHRYLFKLYTLDVLLDLEAGANKKSVEDAMEDHIIEQSELIGLVSR